MYKLGWLMLLSFLLVFAGCPRRQPADQPPPTSPVAADSSREPGETAPPVPAAPLAAPAADGQASTIPQSPNWVQPVATEVMINQPFKVNYKLLEPSKGEAFIALVPAAVTSKTLRDNVDQAVDRVTLPLGATGLVELKTQHPGKYMLRLFPAQTGELSAIAESAVEVTAASVAGALTLTPPYVTITNQKLDEIPAQYLGRPMIAYWELKTAPSDGAWIGLIPVTCTAQDAAANLAAATAVQELQGKVMDRSIFNLDRTGQFVFRIFLGKDAETQVLCESQVFKVIERPKP